MHAFDLFDLYKMAEAWGWYQRANTKCGHNMDSPGVLHSALEQMDQRELCLPEQKINRTPPGPARVCLGVSGLCLKF